MRLVHLSDLHFRTNWHEELGVLITALRRDLEPLITDATHVIFSGDIVQAGSSSEFYDACTNQLFNFLADRGVKSEKLIFVPGNHDVDRSYIETNIMSCKGLYASVFDETGFNQYCDGAESGWMKGKFSNYISFEKTLRCVGVGEEIYGRSFEISGDISVFLLNTALCSNAGVNKGGLEKCPDEGMLYVYTRSLAKYLNDESDKTKILIMHHPLEVLHPNIQKQVAGYAKNFDIVMSGHLHSKLLCGRLDAHSNTLDISAPALFTRKSEKIGYSYLDIVGDEVTVTYRQFDNTNRFVLGTILSGTDTGSVTYKRSGTSLIVSSGSKKRIVVDDLLRVELKKQFDSALSCYRGVDPIWVAPTLTRSHEAKRADDEGLQTVSLEEILSALPDTSIIRALPLFGLTAVGRFLVYEAYIRKIAQLPCSLDSRSLPNHSRAIVEAIDQLVKPYGREAKDVDLILLDDWSGQDPNKVRQLIELRSSFPNAKIIVLSSMETQELVSWSIPQKISFEVSEFFIKALDRSQVREFVRKFISEGSNLDENATVTRLVTHLENINAHRTAYNCLTMLKIYENSLDASPVNRTEMMERFLYILFSSIKMLPRYSTIPDQKDSMYVLGYICEALYKERNVSFTKEKFISLGKEYCASKLMDIEVDVLFWCLIESRILVSAGGEFYFRYAFWQNLFSAHRMHQSEEFFNHVVSNTDISNYPEVVEFYSGIDRRRSDLISILSAKIVEAQAELSDATGITSDFDPFSLLKWAPSNAELDRAKGELEREVESSSLPVEIKDAVADRSYDATKPYYQEVRSLLEGQQLLGLMNLVRAASKALRNSDHADVDQKKILFKEIISSWRLLAQILIAISPILAVKGDFLIAGVHYYLTSSFDKHEGLEKWFAVLRNIPQNVSGTFGRDLYSPKMFPLYKDFINTSLADSLSKHLIHLDLIAEKPAGWDKLIESYIDVLHKNSFELSDITNTLRLDYKYGYSGEADLSRTRRLIGLAFGKHEDARKSLGKDYVKKVAEMVLGSKDDRSDDEAPPDQDA